jgi:hypothetical protein
MPGFFSSLWGQNAVTTETNPYFRPDQDDASVTPDIVRLIERMISHLPRSDREQYAQMTGAQKHQYQQDLYKSVLEQDLVNRYIQVHERHTRTNQARERAEARARAHAEGRGHEDPYPLPMRIIAAVLKGIIWFLHPVKCIATAMGGGRHDPMVAYNDGNLGLGHMPDPAAGVNVGLDHMPGVPAELSEAVIGTV